MLGVMGELILRREAHARGVTDAEIRRLVRNGTWTRLASGVFVQSDQYAGADDHARHALRARAFIANAGPTSALSHVSAAVLHGLDVWQIPLDDVHLTRNAPSGARRTPGRVMHAALFREADVVDRRGARVLSVARTITDVAATVPVEQAVVLADSALRAGLVAPVDLTCAVERMGSHPRIAHARRVVQLSSGCSDSVGESRSRVLFVREQIPLPLTQVDVFSADGRWLARVDFLWPEHGVIGEFDGRIKYRRDGVATTAAEDVVYREKLREDALRHAGWTVVRWTWQDLGTRGAVATKVREAFARAARGSGPTGRYATKK